MFRFAPSLQTLQPQQHSRKSNFRPKDKESIMSAYHVIVQDPIYGFELDGRKYRLQELDPVADGTRRVEVYTDSVVRNESDPSATFMYQVMEDHWEWKYLSFCAGGWDQFHDPLSLLKSLAEFFNNNHPPVMKIHRA